MMATRYEIATTRGLGWFGIARLGLVQSAIGAIVMLATSLLNRVMVVEYALPVALPAGLVAWHYAVQLSRPAWGHKSDKGRQRTPWIIMGMGILALGALLAVDALAMVASGGAVSGYALLVLAFTMIGAGVGAAGTSLLALLATRVAPERRAAAASITWIMMIAGIVVTAGVAGSLIDPFSLARLAMVSGGVALAAFLLSIVAIWGVESGNAAIAAPRDSPKVAFRDALAEIAADAEARRFTLFIFLSMLAYSMQDLILEPFAGLIFCLTPGQSTQLSGAQHGGVLAGMLLVGIGGSLFGGRTPAALRRWTFAGCIGSAAALLGLAMAARVGIDWPLRANVMLLGFANGVFAVAAIGTMMALAGAGSSAERGPREGVRMGVWGAAQAIAFGTGGLTGALAVDAIRAAGGSTEHAFTLVFGAEALLFLAAAWLALHVARGVPRRTVILTGEMAT